MLVEPGDPWWAGVPRSKWPPGLAEEIIPLWHEPHGDRQTELSLPSAESPAEQEALRKMLDMLKAALVDEEEWAAPEQLDDPWVDAWEAALKATAAEELAAEIDDKVRRAFAMPSPFNRPSSLICMPAKSR